MKLKNLNLPGGGTDLQIGNCAFRIGNYSEALRQYLGALRCPIKPEGIILSNIAAVRRRYCGNKTGGGRLRVGVCGWELSHNAAGRAYCLAMLYSEFADAELIGSIFPQWGRDIWEPIRLTSIPKHVFLVEDASKFIEQAIDLVLEHPFDLVHLSKPRAPNIIFGILYKLIWDAKVIMDVDDEELAFIGEREPLEISDYLREHGSLPPLKELTGREWTRLASGLATCFDGVSVSNPALQHRYGGLIVPHVRNERVLKPSPELRKRGRERLGIAESNTVILFFGTPREHKGVLEIGKAMKALGREDLVFAIVGDFPDPNLKLRLRSICGQSCVFLGNQPFNDMAEIVASGDICVLLLSRDSPISKYQVPAKLSDALAMGLKVLIEPTPALRDILDSGAVTAIDRDALQSFLQSALDQQPLVTQQGISRERKFFMDRLSFASVMPMFGAALKSGGVWDSKPINATLVNQVLLRTEPLLHLRSLMHLGRSVDARGISIVVVTLNGAALLERLLQSLFSCNTFWPLELVIIDHGSNDDTVGMMEKFRKHAPIRYVNRQSNYSFASSCNFGAGLAAYSKLLFLNNDIVFTADVLAEAERLLDDRGIGAVGIRLDEAPDHKGDAAVNHYGVRFAWNERRGYFMPEQLRNASRIDFEKMIREQTAVDDGRDSRRPVAVTGAFLLCRRSDFFKVGGFDEQYDYGLEDIDFCLRLRKDLELKCYCINETGLQHNEGSTRKKLVRPDRLDRNHEIFKGRWAEYIREIIYEPTEDGFVERTLNEIRIPSVPDEELRVTIVLAVYGKLKYTLRCLKSIADNTPPFYEIVLMDDCSPDDTGDFLVHLSNIRYYRNSENLGFLLSCNRGVSLSRGGHILYLNNDTVVTPGWLDSLLEVIERPDVGAVGSKLVYPDGSLQEAGGIYWSDAQGTNYGRKDRDPDKSEYNFVREVDKCSGASLLVRKEVIDQTRGFDPRFAPAYKEDADLCFEVRKLGYKVMYQPLSVVIHFEGISCGSDTGSGIKQYQLLNKPKFVEKWGAVLNSQHLPNLRSNVFLARWRPLDAPYVLIIDDKLPEYDRHAGGLGMYQYATLLKEMGFRVIFYPDNKKRTEPYATKLQQAGIEVKYNVSTSAFHAWIEEHGKYLDYVWLSRPGESVKYIDILRKFSKAKLLYCGRDLHYLRHYRRYELEQNPTFLRSSNEFREKEFKLFKMSDVVLLFSDAEAQLIKHEGVEPGKIRVIPAYYYDSREAPTLNPQRKDIVFVGGGKHQPNVDAIIWFVKHCFPLIESRFHDVKLRIVGPDPNESVLQLARHNIDVMGYVENLEGVYAKSRVAIAPIRYGAGVKGKIVNSLSFGIPVVTTSIGMEGMGLAHGVNCLRADTPEGFASEVSRLLMDDLSWHTISSGALAYVADTYSKDAARRCMTEILSHLRTIRH